MPTSSAQVQLQFTPANGILTALSKQFTGAPAGSLEYLGTQSIATSDTTLNVGAVTSAGLLMVVNTDPTNFVQIDANSSYNGFPQKILPGMVLLLAPETTTLHMKADTGAVVVQIFLISA